MGSLACVTSLSATRQMPMDVASTLLGRASLFLARTSSKAKRSKSILCEQEILLCEPWLLIREFPSDVGLCLSSTRRAKKGTFVSITCGLALHLGFVQRGRRLPRCTCVHRPHV